MTDSFKYLDERFADIQMLHYRLKGFEALSPQQKAYVYYLSQATLAGRDITFDQFCQCNLEIRKIFETIYEYYEGDRKCEAFEALVVYLKRLWFSNGIHHHYGMDKFQPNFSPAYFHEVLHAVGAQHLPLREQETINDLYQRVYPILFQEEVMAQRVNKADGQDLVCSSACNYYDGVTQHEAESFYAQQRDNCKGTDIPSFGLNSRLVKNHEVIEEEVYKVDGLYGKAIEQIIYWLMQAREVAENATQQQLIDHLVNFYRDGNPATFDRYSIAWVKALQGQIDFINGFIEVYGDPLGIKASWEGIVEYRDEEATQRTQAISNNAQWFEDHSPVDARFRKPVVKGVSAHVVCAAMLGGDLYPSTAIGINLPNAEWIREQYGSKSVTIGNLIEAYNEVSTCNGFLEEFVDDEAMRAHIRRYGNICDALHTDLHECLGHGSGQLLPGVSADALKAYGSTIEEARADLFGLYYLADEKLLQLGLLESATAFHAQYYTYMLNGLLTQLVRIAPGQQLEEAHMRNRALIARWVYAHAEGAVELLVRQGKTYIAIHDYNRLRRCFGELLAEVQRIKSEGDFEAARQLVEQYAVQIDAQLHQEVRTRYAQLDIAPFKGFVNPVLTPIYDAGGRLVDVSVDYTEGYTEQMLRYSREFGFL